RGPLGDSEERAALDAVCQCAAVEAEDEHGEAADDSEEAEDGGGIGEADDEPALCVELEHHGGAREEHPEQEDAEVAMLEGRDAAEEARVPAARGSGFRWRRHGGECYSGSELWDAGRYYPMLGPYHSTERRGVAGC